MVRLRARARRLKLDRALAAGADPSDSPLLAARAAQLVDPSTRQRIAACLEQFAFTADRPPSRVKTLPLRDAVRPNQQALLELARTLRREQLHLRSRHRDARSWSSPTGPDRHTPTRAGRGSRVSSSWLPKGCLAAHRSIASSVSEPLSTSRPERIGPVWNSAFICR